MYKMVITPDAWYHYVNLYRADYGLDKPGYAADSWVRAHFHFQTRILGNWSKHEVELEFEEERWATLFRLCYG